MIFSLLFVEKEGLRCPSSPQLLSRSGFSVLLHLVYESKLTNMGNVLSAAHCCVSRLLARLGGAYLALVHHVLLICDNFQLRIAREYELAGSTPGVPSRP